MVKLLKYTVLAICLLILLVVGSASWVIYTPAGTTWLLRTLPGWIDIDLTIGQIDGTLGGTLQLKNIELYEPEVELSLDQLSLQNRLSRFFPLTLEIETLHTENLQIKSLSTQQSSQPLSINWPKLPRLLEWLQINLNNINLQDSSWQQQDQPPVQVELVQGDLHWQKSTLQSNRFTLQTGAVRGAGSFHCGMQQPLLKVDLQISSDDSTAVWKTVQLRADLNEGSRQQILAGLSKLDITLVEGDRFVAVSELELTSTQLQLRQFKLTRPDHPGTLTAEIQLDFSRADPQLSGQVQLSQLNLQKETGQPIILSGTGQIKGDLNSYSGTISLINHQTGVAKARATSEFSGTLNDLSLQNFRGKWLNGIISGQAQISWEQNWQLTTRLSGKNLDPQGFDPQLSGNLNLDLQAELSGGDNTFPRSHLQLQLHDSTFHNQPLTGSTDISLQNDTLVIKQLQLHGEGIHLQASGDPEAKLTFSWQIEELGQLLSNASGESSGAGWLRWQHQSLTGRLHSTGKNLAFADWRLDQLSLEAGVDDGDVTTWQLQLDGRSLHNQPLNLDIEQISIGLAGNFDQHRLTLKLTRQQSHATVKLRGSWDGTQWQGKLISAQTANTPFGNWYLLQPVPMLLSAEKIHLELLSIHSDHGGQLQGEGDYLLKKQQGKANIHWENLDLSIIDPLLPDWHISGRSDGSIELKQGTENLLHAEISAGGDIRYQELELQLDHSELLFNWDKFGLQSSLHIVLANQSSLRGNLTSPQKNYFTWPQQGAVQLSGTSLPLEIVQPWLPKELLLSGTLDWDSHGTWQEGKPLDLQGIAEVNNGHLRWEEDDQARSTDINSAELNWRWHKNLSGQLNLELQNHGNIDARFELPLTAELPLTFKPQGNVNVDLHSHTYELGLLSVYYPEYFQKSRAQLDLDLKLTGIWQKPNLNGTFHLYDARVFLPPAGIQLSRIELQGTVVGNRIEVVKLQCQSGKGQLNGHGYLEIKNWLPNTYHAELKGDNFQLLHLMELQVTASPDLTIDGTAEDIKIRGQIMLPNVQINNQKDSGTIANSRDLIIIDSPEQTSPGIDLNYDIDVLLLLGERVFLRTPQVNARLGGSLRIQSNLKHELVGYGKIYVIRGTYFGLGSNLNINYGDIYFTGGPLEQPELDILALRRINIVEVGAKITGTPQEPEIQLYSIPIMPEGDILSYLMTGQPMSASRSQMNLIVTAASALLPPGQSQGLINRVGLDTFYITSASDNVGGEEDTATVITTGKYLNPDLYLSFDYSPDSNTDQVKVRYRLTPVWEVESTVGYDSGADIFYRIEFD